MVEVGSAMLIQMAILRSHEYAADATGPKLSARYATGNVSVTD